MNVVMMLDGVISVGVAGALLIGVIFIFIIMVLPGTRTRKPLLDKLGLGEGTKLVVKIISVVAVWLICIYTFVMVMLAGISAHMEGRHVGNVKGGAKVRRVAGRSKSAAPQRGLAENGGCTAASVAAGAVIGQEALECTATWTSGLRFGDGFWLRG